MATVANNEKGTGDEAGPKPTVSRAENAAYSPEVELIEAAVTASDAEALIPKKELFMRYWPAAVYSMLLSLALVMEGMDVGLINNFYGHPAFKERFGWPNSEGEKEIPATWQGGIGAGNNCGSIIGLLINGYLQSRYGSRKIYMVSLILLLPVSHSYNELQFDVAM